MRRAKAIGRLGTLAIGLGIGAALAASPGIASAAPDIDISFDGVDLFHTPGHTAEAFSGMNDFAIAIGTNSIAEAGSANGPGQFDTAFADGTNSDAFALRGMFDNAFADGTNSSAFAGGEAGGLTSDGDFASAFGPGTSAGAGAEGAMPSANDVALVFDPFATGTHFTSALAGGGLFDFASVFGEDSNAFAGSFLGLGGNFDLAEIFGNGLTSTTATGANFLTDILTGLPF
jgi:hypothetical protein